MKTMKVAMYYNNNDIRIENMPIPEINEKELLVKVKTSGICGSDVLEWYRIKKAPLVLGHEISGDIVKAGKLVKKYKEGDKVFISHHVPCNSCSYCLNDQHTICKTLHSTNYYPGGFAEYLKVPEINVKHGTFLLSEGISYEDGVFIEPLACVIRGMRIADFQSEKSVIVIGSGIAGLLHIKLAKMLGAKRIFATDINDYRLKKAKEFGADYVINANDDVSKKLKDLNNGILADFVFLCTGSITAVDQAINCVGSGGTLMFFAPTEPGIIVPIPLFDLWNKEVKMVSTYAGAPRDIKEAIELIKSKKIIVSDMITHKLPLEDAAKGFRLVSEAKESIKVILEP